MVLSAAGARAACLVAALVVAGGAGACTGGITPGTAYEQPMFVIPASLAASNGQLAGSHSLIRVIWTDPAQVRPDVVMPPGWISSTPIGQSDGYAEARLFRPPPAAAIVEVASPAGNRAEIAFGEIVIVDDADGDDGFRIDGPRAQVAPPDRYLGGTPQVLLFVARPFASPEPGFPIPISGLSGYGMVDLNCAGRLPVSPRLVRSVSFVAQPSDFLPEIRNCMRTHSP